MGSASSKPARKLARAPPAWAGARTPNHVGERPPHPHSRPTPQASETRDEAIERDSKDPQLMANLSRLGPVKVDHHMQPILPGGAAAQSLFQTRLRSEDEARASRPTHNRLLASTLIELLDERKYVTTRHGLDILVNKHGIDLEKLERLARHVNSVTVDPDTVKRWVSDDGTENISMLASWTNPEMDHHTPSLTSPR